MIGTRFREWLRDDPADEQAHSRPKLSDVLPVAQRRNVLQYLARHDQVVTLDELTERITARDSANTIGAERIAIVLHEWYLPKLTEAGLVAYDPDTRTVERQPELAPVVSQLTRVSTH